MTTIQIAGAGGVLVLAIVAVFEAGILTGKFGALKESSKEGIEKNSNNIGELFRHESTQDNQISGMQVEIKNMSDRIERGFEDLKEMINNIRKK